MDRLDGACMVWQSDDEELQRPEWVFNLDKKKKKSRNMQDKWPGGNNNAVLATLML